MTSNFTAAELRELATPASLAGMDQIQNIMAALREYADLKEAAEKGVTDEVVQRFLSTYYIHYKGSAVGLSPRDAENAAVRTALLAVAPLLALKGDKP